LEREKGRRGEERGGEGRLTSQFCGY